MSLAKVSVHGVAFFRSLEHARGSDSLFKDPYASLMSGEVELFDYKLPILTEAGAVSPFDYRNVFADLSLPGWPEVLIAAGFDPAQPTLWLLEGFLGYLTEEEANNLFEKISKTLSAKGSRMVITFLTPATKTSTGMHRFFPENPLSWCNGHGWTGVQTDIHVIAKELGRSLPASRMEGYFIVVIDLL
eukprot:gene35665-43979_t